MARALVLAAILASAAAAPDFLHSKGGRLAKLLVGKLKEVAQEVQKGESEAQTPPPPPRFPESWGPEPEVQTEDWRPLAGGYGFGSGTVSVWISNNIKHDRAYGKVQYPPDFGEPPRMQTRDLVPLPFGYGRGSGTVAKWLREKAKSVYHEDADEFEGLHIPRPIVHSYGDKFVALNPRTVPRPEFPPSWGSPPEIMTADYGPLAGGYGHGSSSLSAWIKHHIQKDFESGHRHYPPAFGKPPMMQTRDLRELPFGYGHGSSTLARWLAEKAREVYNEDAHEFLGHSAGFGGGGEDVFSI